MSHLSAGLVAVEMSRGDGSINTFLGVHSNLAMGTIAMLGGEEQKEHWLPQMARMEKIGAFGLTEPGHGSDTVMLETTARRDGDEYVLNGEKRWIGNASFADVTIIWARDEEDNVGGYLVEKNTPGFDPNNLITGKMGKRAVWQPDVKLVDVRVPLENKLDGANTFQGRQHSAHGHPRRGGVGVHRACGRLLRSRLELCQRAGAVRQAHSELPAQFRTSSPTCSSEITAMQLICFRMAQLREQDAMTGPMASLAKMYNSQKAKQVCSEARDILGGNGTACSNTTWRGT